MRKFLSSILMCAPLACDPELDGVESEIEADDKAHALLDETLDWKAEASTASKCPCWTNCSSDGIHWTKMYFINTFADLGVCHAKAKWFCTTKLAKDYDFANGGCGKHP